jgi:polar amino acid transport system substrate-binding protein
MGEPGECVRCGLFPSFFYTRDSATGAYSGFGIELARRFAEAQGRTLTLREYGAPPDVLRALSDNACDIALIGVDPERGTEVDFSPPYLRADFTFLVQASAGIERFDEVDRPGQRVAVVRNHAMEFALRGKLLRADWVFASTPDQAYETIQAGDADILAGIRPGLLTYADRLPGSRVLPDRYGENLLAFAVAKGRGDWLPEISRFVLDARKSGLIQQIIQATGLSGAAPVL